MKETPHTYWGHEPQGESKCPQHLYLVSALGHMGYLTSRGTARIVCLHAYRDPGGVAVGFG